ncbi:MAG: hypothetical protein ABSD08_22255 [Xanthobacteraceae bacterium]|jgi:hypothetical protein
MNPSTSFPPIDHGEIDDRSKGDRRRSDDDRRKAVRDRREVLRLKTFKGAQIIWRNGAPVACVVRNFSEKGAKLEVYAPVLQNAFELIFDLDQSRRSCRVVWRKEPMMGVKFL